MNLLVSQETDVTFFSLLSFFLPVFAHRRPSTPLQDHLTQPSGRFDCFHALRRPGGRFKAWWDSLGMILLAYDLIAVPLRVFDIGESFFLTVMFWIAHFYWNVSIPLSFITGYDDSGVLVMELRNTIQKYARGWFFFDLALVSFDWAIIAANVWSSATVGFPRSLRFLGLLRLGRVVRVGSAMQLIQEQFGSRMASMQYSVLKIVVQLVISTHIIACLWFLIGSEDHPDSTWVDQLQLKGKTPSLQYATSLLVYCLGGLLFLFSCSLPSGLP